MQRLENENKRLREVCMRSELENEMLALELVNDRVRLKESLDKSEDRIESLSRELQATRSILRESEQHTIRLNDELQQIRQAFQQTCEELQQTQKIVNDYKQICSKLNDRIEKNKERQREKFDFLQKNSCDSCRTTISRVNSPSSASDVETAEEENEEMFGRENQSRNDSMADRLRQVEIELAEKKLALTQALCENQELMHQLRHSNSSSINDPETVSITSNRSVTSNSNSTVSWLSKTVNTIKEAASSTNRTKVN